MKTLWTAETWAFERQDPAVLLCVAIRQTGCVQY